jgi:hypothetical protein
VDGNGTAKFESAHESAIRRLEELGATFVQAHKEDITKLETRYNQSQNDLETERQRSDYYERKIANLKEKLLVKTGRKDNSLNDSDVANRFITLREDIDTLVRNHLTVVPSDLNYAISKMGRQVSPDISSLIVRAFVADWLYKCFFNSRIRIFGIEDSWEMFRLSEKKLEESGMAGKTQYFPALFPSRH